MQNPSSEIHRGWNRRVITGKTLAECGKRLAAYLNDQDYGDGEFMILHESDGTSQNVGYAIDTDEPCYISFLTYNRRL